MALTTCSVATNNISLLDDEPNDTGGLTSAQLKAKHDKFGADFVTWFNETHLPEVSTTGIWNPVIIGYITPGENVCLRQFGEYVKANNKVTVKFAIDLVGKDVNMDGGIVIGGLPFAAKTDFAYYNKIVGVNLATLLNNLCGNVSGETIVLMHTPTAEAFTNVLPSDITNTTGFYGEITYFTDE